MALKKRNGMCPVCYARSLLTPEKGNGTPTLYNNTPYENGMAKKPPMGWSSWNTFDFHIDEKMIYEIAEVMKNKGLADAGYVYVNIDDCWEGKERNAQHELTCDLRKFPNGMRALADKVNALGLKLGIYSSNGTMTCQSYPASRNFGYIDGYTFARWGIEYLKLDYCYHVHYSSYAPWIAGIAVYKNDGSDEKVYEPEQANLSGYAHVFKTTAPMNKAIPKRFKKHISGLDGGRGSAEFTVTAVEDGEYTLSVYTHEVKRFEKFLMVLVNDTDSYTFTVPGVNRNMEYEVTLKIKLKAGANKIKLFNPIDCKSTSDMLEYQIFGKELMQAVSDYHKDNKLPEKKIVFSLCEWGFGKPYLWGASAGNLWRTTGDIKAKWDSISRLYEINVELYPYASSGHWNDPDMLEVGVGDLKYNEYEAHFALWCMMAAPLILGNDVRKMSDELLALVKNKALIDINQDVLGKQCKRIVKGDVDVLVKPLADDKTAICFFNKTDSEKNYSLAEDALETENYINYSGKPEAFCALCGKTVKTKDILSGKLAARSVKVYII